MSEEAIKTFEVDLSDGRTMEIDGPADATEKELLRALTEQLPPEIINVEKTKNTPLGVMLRRSSLEYREDETAEERGERLWGKISGDEVGTGEGIFRAYGQGGAFGWMDELTAEGAAALATLANEYQRIVMMNCATYIYRANAANLKNSANKAPGPPAAQNLPARCIPALRPQARASPQCRHRRAAKWRLVLAWLLERALYTGLVLRKMTYSRKLE